jgi:glycosyltransferase involved in cell wall biosynthesis
MSYGNIRTAVLPDGVDYEYFRGYPEQKKIKHSVLYVGRLIETKGVHDLIMAFPDVIKSIPDAKLFIAGYGEQEEELKRLTAELGLTKSVTFLGKVEKGDVAKYMKSSEIYVLPSYSEGFPLTIAEAMSCGLPIITTNVKGLPEIVKDGVNGYIVVPGDHKALTSRISFLLEKYRGQAAWNIKESLN